MAPPKPFGEIYLITCTPTGKCYVGQTTQGVKARWRGHQSKCRESCGIGGAITKYGAESFILEILDTADSGDELDEKESLWIAKLDSLTPKGYNLKGGGHWNQRGAISDETRLKLSIARRNRPPASPETRAKMRASGKDKNKGRKASEETRKKISLAGQGRVPSPESRKKMSKAALGKKKSPEAIEKCRLSRLGKSSGPMSDECKLKISQALKGKPKSEQHRKNLSNPHKTAGRKVRDILRYECERVAALG